MGTRHQYKCENCGYSAVVSGGIDCGFVAVVQTMICHDCERLVDVLVGRCGFVGPTGDLEYDKELGLCPRCHGNNLTTWTDLRACPKCDDSMINDMSLIVNWD